MDFGVVRRGELMRHIFLITTLSFLFFSPASFSQSTPSVQGYSCSGSIFGSVALGYGVEVLSACQAACRNFGAGASYEDSGCVGDFGRFNLSVGPVAVCLTGAGYEAADAGGFCPDPPGDMGDDKDGDGSDCDEGEENDLDCNDGDDDDTDSDGDGIPDKDDGDDGICSAFYIGDNGEEDPDCEDTSCMVGETKLIGKFDFTESFNLPPQVCGDDGCLYDGYNGNNQVSCTPEGADIVDCWLSQTGETCDACTEPSCGDSDCPVGETRDINSGDCGPIENFCSIDEHTNGTQDNSPDGVPDNQNSPACDDDKECDPLTENCDVRDRTNTYSCDEQPPVCPADASAVDCAILEQAYKLRCSAVITQSETCDQPFNCELTDPALCAIAHTNYLNLCRNLVPQEDIDELNRLLNPTDRLVLDVDSGADYFGDTGAAGSVINLDSIVLDNNSFSVTGSVDSTYAANLTYANAEVDISQSFDLFDILGILVVLSATIYGFRLVNRAHSS